MSSYASDQTAEKLGGWARLCDPSFSPPVELYEAFRAVGLTKEEFDNVRFAQTMPARLRAMLDISEDLLTTWSRYLCGYIEPVHETVVRKRFTDLPLPCFWSAHQAMLAEYQISIDEIEHFIQASVDQLPLICSPYCESRIGRIRTLAGLIRLYPPPDPSGPDLEPSLVPLRPYPGSDGATEALALPAPDEGSNEARNA